MGQADLRHGNPLMCDYTPGSAVTAGDVVVVDEVPCVAHSDIAASDLGALAVGGGVYQVTGDGALSAGAKVYWDDSEDKVTETARGNPHIGFVAPGSSCSGDGGSVDIVHAPVDGQAA